MIAVKALRDFLASGDEAGGLIREIMQALPVAIYTTDADGRLTYFNPAAATLSGRVPEIGHDQWCVIWKTFRSDGTPVPRDQFPMAVALRGSQVPSGVECMAERPDGSRFWFTPCPVVFRDDEGRVIGGMNLLLDITGRKRAEAQAREQFQAIVETTPECVKIVASDGTLLHMNSAGLAILGVSSAGDVIGKNVYDVVAPEDRERFREFNEGICQGKRGSLEFDIVSLGGGRHRMETHASPFRHSDGSTVQLATTRDVSERKQAEQAMLLLGSIVDSSEDAIISKDLNGVITSWNKSAERLFGYTAEEVIGKPITILIPHDRLDEEPKILSRMRRGERVEHFETIRKRIDGSLLDISLTISPVKDAQGNIVGISKIARNITELQRREKALRAANDALAQSNADLQQFAYSASHDLQEPLRMVATYSELLRKEFGGSLDRTAISTSATRSRAPCAWKHSCGICAPTRWLQTPAKSRPTTSARISFWTRWSLSLSRLSKRAGALSLGRGFRGFASMSSSCSSSFKTCWATRSGIAPTIRPGFTWQPSPGAMNGFFPFRITASELRPSTRSQSLKSSNGFTARPSIPEPAWGSRSAAGLSNAPVAESGSNPHSAWGQHFSLLSQPEKTSGPVPERKPLILLAEDNPADALLVRKALEEHGVNGEILVIADGERAIEFIEALDAHPSGACPDLAIIDLNLPKRSGRDVLERMRRSERCRHVPVVILSSSDAQRDRSDAARFGASQYIPKPSRLEEFLSLGAIFKAALTALPD